MPARRAPSSGSAWSSRRRRSSTRSRREFDLHELAVEDADQGAPAPQARGLRRQPARRAQDGALRRRRRRSCRSARSCCSSIATFVVSVRHGEADALAAARRPPRGPPRPAAPRARGGPPRDHRPRRRRLRAGGRRRRRRHPGDRGARSSPPSARTRPSASTSSSARSSTSTARSPRSRRRRPAGARALRRRPDELHDYFRDVHDHLLRVVGPRSRPSATCSPSALQANLTQVIGAPERGHAQDLRVGRHPRRADEHRPASTA